MDMMILALKHILLAAAAVVFCVVSVFIMTYVTVMAFKRDHDWSKVAAATKTIAGKGLDIATQVGKKAGEMASDKLNELQAKREAKALEENTDEPKK